MSGRSDCRKFAPNIFNKSKCTNCFRQKEEHSAEALESNRASRKVSKCGYLFVAPGWDFSNPLNRTKRWQRRWFVLYDDGELTYSLDEHPDTVPQASIDMTTVLEVSEADEVTGHPHSLAVTAPERVTFVKGTCREEARWWADVLTVFPRSKGRHKRNATFPGGQPTSLLQSSTVRGVASSVSVSSTSVRPRYNSCHAGGWAGVSRAPPPQHHQLQHQQQQLQPSQLEIATAPVALDTKVYTDQPVSSASPPTRDKINGEEKARSRRRDANTPSQHHDDGSAPLMRQYDEQLRDIAASLTRPRRRVALLAALRREPRRETPTRDDHDQHHHQPVKRHYHADISCQADNIALRGSPDGGTLNEILASTEDNGAQTESGDATDAGSVAVAVDADAECNDVDADGDEARVELPSERLLHARAGWLQRRGVGRDRPWSRHWFVLRGAALLYYRDPQAEHRGIMDGVIDLSGVSRVTQLPPPAAPGAGYAFETETWDNKLHILSAVTAGIRANWVSAIRRTAGLPEPSPLDNDDTFMMGKTLALIGRQDSTDTSESSVTPTTPVTPMTPRSQMFSSDDEYRTASEGGRRDSVDWGDISQLPPSPILNRTPISRVKEKVRLRLSSHNHISVLPSPQSGETPQSDVDEIDSNRELPVKECQNLHNDLIENAKNEQSQYLPLRTYISFDKQSIEIEDLRKQLKIAMNDVTAAEKELNRLRKVKAESVLRERKIEELVLTLQKTEDELQRRSKEADSLESLKQLHSEDKSAWETKIMETEKFLKDSKKHCELLSKQLTTGQETIKRLQQELSLLNEKLIRKVEENTELHLKVRNLEISVGEKNPLKEKWKSMNSLSELENINLDLNLESLAQDKLIEEYKELQMRFLKAIQEIKAMKVELRESYGLYDELELSNHSLRKEMEHREKRDKSQIALMAERIQDLTTKLTASDKQVRSLKHRLQKSESRDKRRSLSLKGNESFSLGREVEDKLVELENKISILESNKSDAPFLNTPSKQPSPTKDKGRIKELTLEEKKLKRIAARLRRKSLDSATSSEPMKMLIRLSSLETKVCNALHERGELATSLESISQGTSESPFSNESPDGSTIIGNSHKHLVERLQSLENIVINSRNKVNQCLCQITNLRSSRLRRSPSPSLDKNHSMRSIEKSLIDISKTLQDCFDKCIVECAHDTGKISEDIRLAVEELEGQFRTKFMEISKKKMALLENGQLDHQKNLELCAEKLAYEAFMINKIHEAIGTKANSLFSKLIISEIDETSKLIDDLQIKIDEPNSERLEDSHKTLKDSLARILTRRIEYSSSFMESVKTGEFIARKSDLESLKQMHRRLTAAFEKFKTDKVTELAATDVEGSILQAAASSALCAAAATREAARALRRATYPASQTSLVPSHADLEPWWHAAHERLQYEANNVVAELNVRRISRPRRIADHGHRALCQLAEAIAYKVLIDARMAAFEDMNKSSLDNACLPESKPSNRSGESSPNHSMVDLIEHEDFMTLFRQFSKECVAFVKNERSHTDVDLQNINESIQVIEDRVRILYKDKNGSDDSDRLCSEESGIEESIYSAIIDKCTRLKNRVEALANLPCKSCERLQENLERMKADHTRTENTMQQQATSLSAARRARTQLQAQHEHERTQRERERTQHDKERIQHENERTQLREHTRRLERRLSTLDAEYSQQLENLKTAYRDTLVTDLAGDSLRVRYQAEIEQLRALCEKGLLAMESSHRRIIQEMEEKHKAERDQLRLDKEQALAEETRATLAALDAMRKAHESEVRREVDKFKADFLVRLASSRTSYNMDQGEHPSGHQHEMEEIKREILSLSEKYSIKCVESASLEEKLSGATQQLQQAKQQILQLDARNKQLRAHLMAEAKELKSLDCTALAHVIDESPLHVRVAGGGGDEPTAPLWEHLRHLASVWQKANLTENKSSDSSKPRAGNVCSPKDKDSVCKDRKYEKPPIVTSSELKTGGCSSRGPRTPRASLLPLVGMVAERKKRFEL